LYLSDLAYVDSETQIRDGLATVNNDGWQLLYVDTKGNPKEPAHFLAVEKQAAPLKKSKSNDKTHPAMILQKRKLQYGKK